MSAVIKGLMSYIPPGLTLSVATAYIEDGKYWPSFRSEFLGTLLMIICTFSAGKWIGSDDVNMAWFSHAVGVVMADYFGGGPHVNPAVTMSMWCLDKVCYTEAYVRIAAQLGGGLVAFPLYHAISNTLSLTPFGGPEYSMDDDADPTVAAVSEFSATVLLLFAIYILNWELHFQTYHYIIKQSLTAVAIRTLIELFPTAGPAMNPMLATTWYVFGVGTTYEYPTDFNHYLIYWIAPFAGAILASTLYVIYAGGTIFGNELGVGPFKPSKAAASKTSTTTTTKKKTN